MNLIKKSSKPFAVATFPNDQEFAAILEPKPGYSAAEVERVARSVFASQLQWLDASKLSAVIGRSALDRLSTVANVSPKRLKAMR
jgi:hypothetical protein